MANTEIGSLAAIDFHTSYHRGRDDLAGDFYLPAMRAASAYDRAVGYFRSAVFVIAWPALRDFVGRGSRIRIVCSQVLSTADIAALDAGYAARTDARLAERLRGEVETLLADEEMREPARVLAALVATGVIEFRIAILPPRAPGAPEHRIFHDKLGIFRDAVGNVVVHTGSMNETWMGLAGDGNLEAIRVACSWMGDRDHARTSEEESYFADLWEDRYPGVRVRPFPETAREDLVAAADPDWERTVERLVRERPARYGHAEEVPDPRGRRLKSHQAAGLADWRAHDRRGILAFATGAGKTFTALVAMREAITQYGEVPVVVVPDTTLFAQWLDEIRTTLGDLDPRILRVGADNDRWRDGMLATWTARAAGAQVVLATLPTARSEEFRDGITAGPHLLLVADEVHRVGSTENRALLDDSLFGARLGLSATPERAGDPVGTGEIMRFFGSVLEPRYTLADAVADGVLTPYFYRPHPIELNAQELARYRELSGRIAVARARVGDVPPGERVPGVDMLLFQRARIVKRAAAKVGLAVEVLRSEYAPGQAWIVYCDDQDQMNEVVAALAAVGLTAMPYHSAMTADRPATLRWLADVGGIVVAIRCLDEGIDVPSVTHALILASSKNPREYVQRRGRVLRRAPGKALAFVHDALVVPPRRAAGEDQRPDAITAGEIARALEFANGADNPAAFTDLELVAIRAGIDWTALTREGMEDDDD